MEKETLCWGCQNYSKCSWSRGIPVENWEATPTTFIDKYGNAEDDGTIEVHSFVVHKCPQYIPDTIQKTTINEIAKIVGVNKRTLYRHFQDTEKSKEILKRLREKGYKLRTYACSPYYWLEKISNDEK